MRHSTLALMLLVLQFSIVLKIAVEAGLLSLSQVLRNFCCHRITFSYGLTYLHKTGTLLNDFEESQAEVLEQREFITSQDPQDLVLFINLYGLVFLLSMILVCQCFYLILLED